MWGSEEVPEEDRNRWLTSEGTYHFPCDNSLFLELWLRLLQRTDGIVGHVQKNKGLVFLKSRWQWRRVLWLGIPSIGSDECTMLRFIGLGELNISLVRRASNWREHAYGKKVLPYQQWCSLLCFCGALVLVEPQWLAPLRHHHVAVSKKKRDALRTLVSENTTWLVYLNYLS